jgi:hypothetical protein
MCLSLTRNEDVKVLSFKTRSILQSIHSSRTEGGSHRSEDREMERNQANEKLTQSFENELTGRDLCGFVHIYLFVRTESHFRLFFYSLVFIIIIICFLLLSEQ